MPTPPVEPALPLGRFFSQSALYAVGGAFVRAGNFLLLPVYWRFLTPSDFGVLAITELVSIGLLGILTLCMEGALTRFYHEWPEEERPRWLGTLWIASLGGSLLVTLIAYAAFALLWDGMIRQVPFEPYVQLAVAGAFARCFSTIPFALLRMQERLVWLNLAGFASFVFTSAVSLYLVIVEGAGIKGLLIGTIAGHSMVALLWIVYMARHVAFRVERRFLGPALSYSLPLVPAVAATWISTLCDRFFLDRFVPLSQIGLYATGGRFSGLVKEGHQALKNAWIPSANLHLLKRVDGRDMVSRLATYYVSAVVFGGLMVALFAREFLLVFDRGDFRGSAVYVPILVLATMAGPFDVLAGLGLSMMRRSKTVLALALFECVISVGTIGFLTWRWGPIGTAWGVAGGAALAVAIRFGVSLRFYPMPYEFGRLAAVVLLAAGVFAASVAVTFDSVALSALVKAVLLALFGTLAWSVVRLKATPRPSS